MPKTQSGQHLNLRKLRARVISNPDANRKGERLESCLEAITNPIRVDPPCEKDGKIIQRFWTIGTTVTINPGTDKVV